MSYLGTGGFAASMAAVFSAAFSALALLRLICVYKPDLKVSAASLASDNLVNASPTIGLLAALPRVPNTL